MLTTEADNPVDCIETFSNLPALLPGINYFKSWGANHSGIPNK
jgi:hypothetical protein